MELELAKKLLAEKNLILVEEENNIYHDDRVNLSIPLENHYAIRNIENQWNFCFIELERRTIPKIKKIRAFKNKSDAITYLFLYLLRRYFFNKYIVPSRDRGYPINSLQSLKLKMLELGIPDSYICEKENLKKHSICFYETENGWFEGFVGEKNKIIAASRGNFTEEEFFINIRLDLIYGLYLLDNYRKEVLKNSNIMLSFSDYEIVNYLEYPILFKYMSLEDQRRYIVWEQAHANGITPDNPDVYIRFGYLLDKGVDFEPLPAKAGRFNMLLKQPKAYPSKLSLPSASYPISKLSELHFSCRS